MIIFFITLSGKGFTNHNFYNYGCVFNYEVLFHTELTNKRNSRYSYYTEKFADTVGSMMHNYRTLLFLIETGK